MFPLIDNPCRTPGYDMETRINTLLYYQNGARGGLHQMQLAVAFFLRQKAPQARGVERH
jgi:hypothetical protein